MQFLFEDVHGRITFLYNRSFLLRLGKGALVHLLVLVQGDGIYLHRHGGHHVRRLLIHDEVIQGFDVNLLIAHDVGGNELTSATTFFIKGLYGCVLDARELTDHGFHLFQFDAETTDLHLSVSAAYKLDVAGGQIAHDIARAVHTRKLMLIGEGIVDIYFSRLLRTIQVAPAHLRAADPQLARCTYRQTVALRVNDIEVHIVDGTSDGDILLLMLYGIDGYEHRRLCGTIEIAELETFWWIEGCQFLTTGGEELQRVVLDICSKLIAHLRGHKRVGDLVLLEIVIEGNQVKTQLLRDDMQRSTTSQGWIHIHHTGIKSVAGVSSHLVFWFQTVEALVPMTETDDIAVHQLTTLGHTR